MSDIKCRNIASMRGGRLINIIFFLFFILIPLFAQEDENIENTEETIDVNLGQLNVIGESSELSKYQSGASVGKNLLDSSPSGNGDITSALKMLPNIQYDSAQQASTTPGEIDPANISISGGLYYQNLFLIDGIGMNNDLDPANSQGSNPVSTNALPGRSQGLNIDTFLLDSIVVQDSNISAKYGGFSGGIVEAKTKEPSKLFGINLSYQITQGSADPDKFSMTKYHIMGGREELDEFINTDSPTSGQPEFIKHIVRASIESKFRDDAGIIASFTTTQSFIPVKSYASSYVDTGNLLDDAQKELKRQSYNVFLKGFYDVSDSLRLEASYSYMPQYNTYFIRNTKNSDFSMESGGHQAGIKTQWDNAIGSLNVQISASQFEASRSGSAKDMRIWRYSEAKNWNPNGTNNEGGYGNVDTSQIDVNAKISQDFIEVGDKYDFWSSVFSIGLEAGYTYAKWQRYEDSYYTFVPTSFLSEGQTCSDDYFCDSSTLVYNNTTYYGQYATSAYFYGAGKIDVENTNLAGFFESDMKLNFREAGILNVRTGARLEYDTMMENINLAPRISVNYDFPWNKKSDYGTRLIFGYNKYYGRNLYTYALMDGRNSLNSQLTRSSETDSWSVSTQYRNNTRFDQLKTPYSLELTGGISQQIWEFKLMAKYIKRYGVDEIRRGCYSANGEFIGGSCGSDGSQGTTSTNYYRYNNTGSSESDIISISIENPRPLGNEWIANSFLFAFDWTNTKRNYVDYADNISTGEWADELISYDGQIIRSGDMPSANYNRPYTLRFNTITQFNIFNTIKATWSNFFRFRSKYKAMTSVTPQDRIDTDGDGVLDTSVTTYRPTWIKNAFTWDVRFGIEYDFYNGNTFYVNLDILNILDNVNEMVEYSTSASGVTTPTVSYEVGRSFWVQIGYKY